MGGAAVWSWGPPRSRRRWWTTGEGGHMKAAVLHGAHQALPGEEVTVDHPHGGEVLVRLVASGVCRSDLHAAEGRSPVFLPPMVMGHEGAGIVEAVGPGVQGVRPGDHVVIALYGPCGP